MITGLWAEGATYLLAFLGFWSGEGGGAPRAPEPRASRASGGFARGRRAGVRWVGPLSGSLFAVTVLGAGLSLTDTARGRR